MSTQHFFVTGMFRSGTTFMARALNAHPELCVLSDPHREFFRFLRNQFFQSRYNEFNPNSPLSDYFLESPSEIAEFHEQLFRIKLSDSDTDDIKLRVVKGACQFSPLIVNTINKLQSGTSLQVYNQLIELGANAYGANSQTLKGTKEVWTDEFIEPLLNEGRKCIQIIRDPRAVIASNRVSKTGAYPILFLIRQWRKSVAYYLKNKGKENFIMLRYEDIVTDPMNNFTKVTEFLNVPFSNEVVNPKKYKDGQGDKWSQNSSHGSSETINTNFMEKWRKVLSKTELKFIESFCLPEMNLLDYTLETSGDLPADEELYTEAYENIAPWITEFDFFLNNHHLENERLRLNALKGNTQSNPDVNLFITKEAHNLLSKWV